MVHVETTQRLIADLNAEFTRWREGGHVPACQRVDPMWPLDFQKENAWECLLLQMQRVQSEYRGFSQDEGGRLQELVRRVESTVNAS
jgi:hypothetical protein